MIQRTSQQYKISPWHPWLLDCVHKNVQRSTARDWIVLPPPPLILGEASRLAEKQVLQAKLQWRVLLSWGWGGYWDRDLLASSEDSQNGQRLSLKGTFCTCIQTTLHSDVAATGPWTDCPGCCLECILPGDRGQHNARILIPSPAPNVYLKVFTSYLRKWLYLKIRSKLTFKRVITANQSHSCLLQSEYTKKNKTRLGEGSWLPTNQGLTRNQFVAPEKWESMFFKAPSL